MTQEHAGEKTPPPSSFAREASDFQTAPERLRELGSFAELRPLIAANAGTPATYLQELSKDEDAQIRQAVAQNPNTPLECLLALAREFPEAFLLNPLLPLLDLTQPAWYTRIDDLTWLFLLKSSNLPRHLLNRVETRKRQQLTTFPFASKQGIDPYGVWVTTRLRVEMPALHTNGEHIIPELAEELAFVAQHAHTPAPLLAELAAIHCDDATVAELGTAVCEQVRRDVAQNSAAPEPLLRQLALDKDQKVRYRVSCNPRTPADVLAQLARDTVIYVRSGVASNPSTPVTLLEMLADDTSYEEQYTSATQQIVPHARLHDVRRMQAQEALNYVKIIKGALASNPSTPLRILERLASHPEPEVRERLAHNPAVPEPVLRILANDSAEQVLQALLRQAQLPGDLLRALSSHQQSRVRVAVANHPRAHPELLVALSDDAHIRVREAVAQNPRTPLATLERLLEHGEAIDGTDTLIRAALARNPASSPTMLRSLSSSQVQPIIIALAKNPCLPDDVITQLVKHTSEGVRRQIAEWPGLSLAHLELLAQDNESQVKRLAQKRLELWRVLGEHGQKRYTYFGTIDEHEPTILSLTTQDIPFYEILRRAQRLDPPTLQLFLERFQLPMTPRTELLTLLLPTWCAKWKEHRKHIISWSKLLAEIELSSPWQSVFASSPLWQERYLMALRPDLELAQLEQLADDNNRYVREAARWYLRCRD